MRSIEVHVASININKITRRKFEATVVGMTAAPRKQPDIIFVQETKIENAAEEGAARAILSNEYDFHHNAVYCNYKQFKQGCGVFVRRASPIFSAGAGFLRHFDWDIEGRVCVWDAGAFGLFVGVYLPTPNMKREKDADHNEIADKLRGFERRRIIDDKLSLYLRQNKGRVTVVTGDFNVAQAAIDSKSKMWTGQYDTARSRFAKLFIEELELRDSFRVMHPHAKKVTSLITHTGELMMARIDLVLVPQRLLNDNRLRAADVLDSPYFVPSDEVVKTRQKWNYGLDHLPVVATLMLPLAPLVSLDMLAPMPTNVEQDGPHHSKVTIRFTPPSMAVTGYKVRCYDGVGSHVVFNLLGDSEGATKKGLDPSKVYTFEIQALAGPKEGPWSAMSSSTAALQSSVPTISKRPASPHPEQPSSKKLPSHESA